MIPTKEIIKRAMSELNLNIKCLNRGKEFITDLDELKEFRECIDGLERLLTQMLFDLYLAEFSEKEKL